MRHVEELDDGAEARAVEEAPHDDGDDAWDGVGHEGGEPEEAAEADHGGIHQQRNDQREDHHHRNLHQAEEDDAPDAIQELWIAQRPKIVICSRPDNLWRTKSQPAALDPVEALRERIEERGKEETDEECEEWR